MYYYCAFCCRRRRRRRRRRRLRFGFLHFVLFFFFRFSSFLFGLASFYFFSPLGHGGVNLHSSCQYLGKQKQAFNACILELIEGKGSVTPTLMALRIQKYPST